MNVSFKHILSLQSGTFVPWRRKTHKRAGYCDTIASTQSFIMSNVLHRANLSTQILPPKTSVNRQNLGEGRETGGRAEERRAGQPLHQERRVLGFQVGFELLVGVVLMIIFNLLYSVSCTF